MQHALQLPGAAGKRVTVDDGGFLSGPKLLIDGQAAPKGPKRGEYLVRGDDGRDRVVALRPRVFSADPIPEVSVDGQKVALASALPWYQTVWSGLPLLLVLQGGLIGGLFGFVALRVNGRIFRSDRGAAVRYLLTGATSVAATIAYLCVALLFLALAGR